VKNYQPLGYILYEATTYRRVTFLNDLTGLPFQTNFVPTLIGQTPFDSGIIVSFTISQAEEGFSRKIEGARSVFSFLTTQLFRRLVARITLFEFWLALSDSSTRYVAHSANSDGNNSREAINR
jgi:hypothetical protein